MDGFNGKSTHFGHVMPKRTMSKTGASRCSEGFLLRRSIVPKVHCSEGSLFRRFVDPKVRWSEGSFVRIVGLYVSFMHACCRFHILSDRHKANICVLSLE